MIAVYMYRMDYEKNKEEFGKRTKFRISKKSQLVNRKKKLVVQKTTNVPMIRYEKSTSDTTGKGTSTRDFVAFLYSLILGEKKMDH